MIREKKHMVYKMPDGKRLVVSKTPSDPNNIFNTMRDLKRLMKKE